MYFNFIYPSFMQLIKHLIIFCTISYAYSECIYISSDTPANHICNRHRQKRELTRPDFTIIVNETQIGPIAKIEPFIDGERYEIIRMIPPPEIFYDQLSLKTWRGYSTPIPNFKFPMSYTSSSVMTTPDLYRRNFDATNLQYPIELDPNTGIFTIPQSRNNLDYETAQTIELFLNIYTLDGGQESQRVIIKVRDVNDEKPRFVNSPLPLQAVIPENAGPGTIVYKLLAQDPDAGAYLRYSLDLDNSKKFKVDPITGTVEVKTPPNVLTNRNDPNSLPSTFGNNGASSVNDNFGPSGTEYKLRVAVRDIAGSVDQVDIRTLSVMVGYRSPQFFFTEADRRRSLDSEARANQPLSTDDRSDANAYAYTINVLEDTPPGPDTIIGRIKAKSFSNKAIIYELLPAMPPNSPQLNELATSTFSISPTGGDIKLLKKINYEDFSQPKRYSFKVQVTEKDEAGNSGLTNTADLYFDVIDVNDNDPIFSQPEYVKQKVPEDIPIGTEIIKVSATDLDSNGNGLIKYSLSDTQNFTVTSDGVIKNRAALDYESTRKHSYEFTVYATDQGMPKPRTSSASVKIFVSNVNDEAPVFSRSVYVPEIAEDAKPGAIVTTVNAVDPDGDGVEYFFKGGSENSDDFHINRRDGVITINNDPSTVLRKEFYTLNVTAIDDGTCCNYNQNSAGEGGMYWDDKPTSGASGPKHVTEALVVVRVLDINNNKPEFPHCSEYNPTVLENSPPGTPVITVKATDSDSGDNGRVAYKIEPGRNRERLFSIDPQSGLIRTEAILDRESIGGVKRSLTVIATDQAQNPLIGVCTFSVNIGDRNDNEPSFSQSQYDTSIEANTPVNTTFLRVAAQDPDEGPNAEIHYGFDRDNDFFSIDPETGWISVKSSLLTEAGEQFNLTAFAQDKGIPDPLSSTVSVRVVVRGDDSLPPVWLDLFTAESHRYTLDEMSLRGTEIATLRALSNHIDPRVRYSILPGNNPEQNSERNFELKTVNTSAVIWLYSNVDYERVQKYNLTIRAKNNALIELVTDTYITIEIIDANDNAPIFTLDNYPASVPEEAPVGTNVIKVVAEDADLTHPNNLVSYSIVQESENLDWKNFQIDPDTGQISTLNLLDREKKSYYLLKIMAKDGAPSAINIGSSNKGYAYVRINVEDVNDNVPYFLEPLYVADVNEDAVEGTVVTEVSARDADEDFQRRYQILRGNIGGVFDVKPQTGEIYIRGQLDYELGPRNYTLTVVVSDGLNENVTTVKINVKDVNDNAPEFDKTLYEVNLPEETDTFAQPSSMYGTSLSDTESSTGLPHTILQIRATDKDTALPADIRYSLQGQGVEDGTFVVDPMTGHVKVTKKLDRDPPHGQAVWSLLALATDDGGQGNYGYADIRVILEDINDNAPYFKSSYNGYVPENSEAGRPVMTVTAIDNDEGENARLTYNIKTNVLDENKNPIFGIEPQSGLITTLVSNLDRESLDHYTIEVEAKDKDGLSGVGSVTIHVEDRNDQQPQFTQKTYHVTVPEDFPVMPNLNPSAAATDKNEANANAGPSIISILARDADIGDNAKLTYLVKGEKAYTTYDHYLKSQAIVGDIETRYQNSGEGITTNFNKPQTFMLVTDESLNTGLLKLIKQLEYDLWSSKRNNQNYHHHHHPEDQYQNSLDNSMPNIYRSESNNDDEEYVSVDENPSTHRFYVLAIEVSDGIFKDWATIQISVTDVNDNPPIFEPDFLRVPVSENSVGPKFLARFVARDIDSNENGLFDYFILPSPFQPENSVLFSINASGHVMFNELANKGRNIGLDAEVRKYHVIDIIARDHGYPPLIGRAKLRVDVLDVNDNYPKLEMNDYFYKKHLPHIPSPQSDTNHRWQQLPQGLFPPLPQTTEVFGDITPSSNNVKSWKPHVLGLFTATDSDSSGFGAPFKFYSVPCDVNPLCRTFNVTNVQDDGPNINGAALVTVLSTFDRENLVIDGRSFGIRGQKWLDYPIKICDSGMPPLCGIDHLRIIIADINDNPTTNDEDDETADPRQPYQTSSNGNLKNPEAMAGNTFNGISSEESTTDQKMKNRIKRGSPHQKTQQRLERDSRKELIRSSHVPNHKNIYVHIYKGYLPRLTKIGRVFVSDRDDWLLAGDKHFSVISQSSSNSLESEDIKAYLQVDKDLGDVYLSPNIPDGKYELNIDVTDVKKLLGVPGSMTNYISSPIEFRSNQLKNYLSEPTYRATVAVYVKRFDDDALANSASFTLSGISPEQFLGQDANYFDTPLSSTYALPGTNDHYFLPESNVLQSTKDAPVPPIKLNRLNALRHVLFNSLALPEESNGPRATVFEILTLADSSLVKHGQNFPKTLDFRFAIKRAVSSPPDFPSMEDDPPRYRYIPSIKLNGILWKYKTQIERALSVNVTAIDIPISVTRKNHLKRTTVGQDCDKVGTGGSSDIPGGQLLALPYLVDTNRTAVLSHMFFIPSHKPSTSMTTMNLKSTCVTLGEDWCFNGGHCIMDPSPRCICPNRRMGIRCQISRISIKPGGWILLPPLPTSNSVTVNENGNIRLLPSSVTGQSASPFTQTKCEAIKSGKTSDLLRSTRMEVSKTKNVLNFDFLIKSRREKRNSNPLRLQLLYIGPYDLQSMLTISHGVPAYVLYVYLLNDNRIEMVVERVNLNGDGISVIVTKKVATITLYAPYALIGTGWHNLEIIYQENDIQANLDRTCNFGYVISHSLTPSTNKALTKNNPSSPKSHVYSCVNRTRINYENILDGILGPTTPKSGNSFWRTLYDFSSFGSLVDSPTKYPVFLGSYKFASQNSNASKTTNEPSDDRTKYYSTCFKNLLVNEMVYDFGIDTLSSNIELDGTCKGAMDSCPLGTYGIDCQHSLKPIEFGREPYKPTIGGTDKTSPSYLRLSLNPPSLNHGVSNKDNNNNNLQYLSPSKLPSLVFSSQSNVLEFTFQTTSPRITSPNTEEGHGSDKTIHQRIFQATNLDGSHFMFVDVIYPKLDGGNEKNIDAYPSRQISSHGYNQTLSYAYHNNVKSINKHQAVYGYLRFRYSLGYYPTSESSESNQINFNGLRGDQLYASRSSDPDNEDVNDNGASIDFYEVSTKVSFGKNVETGPEGNSAVPDINYCPIGDGTWKYVKIERIGYKAKISVNCSGFLNAPNSDSITVYSSNYFQTPSSIKNGYPNEYVAQNEYDYTLLDSVTSDAFVQASLNNPATPYNLIPEKLALLELDSRAFFLGARVREIGNKKFDVGMQFRGCMQDFRFDSVGLPLSELVEFSNAGSPDSSAKPDNDFNGKVYSLMEAQGISVGCSSRDKETSSIDLCEEDGQLLSKCPTHLSCLPRNGYFVCECPFGTFPIYEDDNLSPSANSDSSYTLGDNKARGLSLTPSECVPFDVCHQLPNNPCHNGGRCITLPWSSNPRSPANETQDSPTHSRHSAHFRCECVSGWGCQFCDCPFVGSGGHETPYNYKKRMAVQSNYLGISMSALLLIILALLFVIILTSILFFYLRCFHSRKKSKADELIGSDDSKKHFNEFGTRMAEDYFYDDEDDAIARQHKESGEMGDEDKGNDMTAGGEFDSPFAYDITRLRKPVLSQYTNGYGASKEESRLLGKAKPESSPYHQLTSPRDHGKSKTTEPAPLADLIRDRLDRVDNCDDYPIYTPFHFTTEDDPGLSRRSISGSLSSLGSGDEDDLHLEDINEWGPKFQKLADLCGV